MPENTGTMKIRDYIQELVGRRLAKAECLVLYDPERRYRELSLALESAHHPVGLLFV